MKTLLFASLIVSSFQVIAASSSDQAVAELKSPSMTKLKSDIKFKKTAEGVKVVAVVSGLNPGSVHGFHIHEKGECKGPDFKSAGEHFNPMKHAHNSPAAAAKHAGDLGNLIANEKGIAKTEVIIKEEKDVSLSNMIGRSVVLHDKPDDLTSQPSGDSGDRIACGIIKSEKI